MIIVYLPVHIENTCANIDAKADIYALNSRLFLIYSYIVAIIIMNDCGYQKVHLLIIVHIVRRKEIWKKKH